MFNPSGFNTKITFYRKLTKLSDVTWRFSEAAPCPLIFRLVSGCLGCGRVSHGTGGTVNIQGGFETRKNISEILLQFFTIKGSGLTYIVED